MLRSRTLTVAAVCAALLAAGCRAPEPPAAPAISEDALRSLEVSSEFAPGGKAKLVDGAFETPAAPGSASMITVRLTDHVARGDLDGDGDEDVAVVLVESGGGSGNFRRLAVVLNDEGKAKDAGGVALGDRVKVKTLAVESGKVRVTMLTHGPKDPMFNPTVETTRAYELRDGKVVEVD